MRLDITLIGDIALGGESDEPRRTISGANARVALALLALERAQGVTSERLAEALWPDGLPATWGSALRMTMSRVRSFIKDALDPTAPDPIVAQGGRYTWQLPDGVLIHIDVEDAEQALLAAREALASGDAARAYQDASHAASRLRGPFLAGRHGTWVDEQRDRLSDLLVAALEVGSEAAAASGDAATALALADDAVERAPLRESAHRALIRVHLAEGNHAEALRQRELYRRLLHEQLGVEPSPQLDELLRI